WFLDLNSVSPRAKQNVAEIVHAAGARYVEAVIMSPIAPARVASRILLGGPHAREFGVLARGLGFAGAEFFDENIGRASATKMCRSVIVKGMEALLLEALLAARAEGVDDEVLASLGNVFPHPNWPAHAHYLISRALQHGARRAEEMREAARTVADAGIAPWMAEACASRQQWAAQFGEFHAHSDLHALLDEMRAVNATGFAQERKSR
ncbi:MAG: DUF1932 domain-containing protein, partial [Gammaproteobacteria bacterium]|nr:DUF1932 domain-containing protein [Gammaproteobacteria bacterium]